MPIFEYSCRSCGYRFEELVRGDEKIVCPKCSAESPEKRLSVFASHAGSPSTEASPACACDGFASGRCGSGLCGSGAFDD